MNHEAMLLLYWTVGIGVVILAACAMTGIPRKIEACKSRRRKIEEAEEDILFIG